MMSTVAVIAAREGRRGGGGWKSGLFSVFSHSLEFFLCSNPLNSSIISIPLSGRIHLLAQRLPHLHPSITPPSLPSPSLPFSLRVILFLAPLATSADGSLHKGIQRHDCIHVLTQVIIHTDRSKLVCILICISIRSSVRAHV